MTGIARTWVHRGTPGAGEDARHNGAHGGQAAENNTKVDLNREDQEDNGAVVGLVPGFEEDQHNPDTECTGDRDTDSVSISGNLIKANVTYITPREKQEIRLSRFVRLSLTLQR